MSKYKLIIFDFDGTLVDTAPDIAYYANQILEERGFPAKSIEEVKQAVGRGVHELLNRLAPELRDEKLNEAVDIFKCRYKNCPVIHSAAYPDVVQMLSGPLQPFQKAIFTNKPQDITERILKILNLEHFFGQLVGWQGGFPPKPDPAGGCHLMEVYEASPETTILIGDSYVDAQTASNMGAHFGFCSYGYDPSHGHCPEFHFNSSREWVSILNE